MPDRAKTSKKKGRRKKPRSRFQRWLVRWGWILPVGALIIGGSVLLFTYTYAKVLLPEDVDFVTSSAEVYDREGNLIGTFSDEVRRFLIDTSTLEEYVGQAVVASEDRDFYEHGGVSYRGIARAAWANITGGEIAQGGSTITQQYVKNSVLTAERTFTRKAKEAMLAIKLENKYSKDQILGFYLNTIYLGRGAYGIEAAARTYFDKHASELTLSEAAYFAGIIPAPERYQLDRNHEGAIERRDRVLDLMKSQGYISAFRFDEAKRQKLELARSATREGGSQKAAYFIEWIRREYLRDEYEECLFTCGLKIYTTLDPQMQVDAETAVASILTESTDPQAALVSITPRGEVRAFVGGRDFRNVAKARGFNFASDVGRQPGSSLKPLTLLAAIEEGISPDSRFSGSSPRTIDDETCNGGEPWPVDNYGGSSFGTMTLEQATTNSVNTIYAQLIAEIGAEPVADLLEDFGFSHGPDPDEVTPHCSLALGGSDLNVTAVEMARAYAGFAARGRVPDVMPIRYITDSTGHCLKEYLPQSDIDCDEEAPHVGDQVVDQNSADVLNETLTHVVEEGTASAAIDLDRQAAGKTGTTTNNVDAWFVGYVPQLTTAVWMGYPSEEKDGQRIVPQMGYCADVELCRPVHGIEVTGGSFPAQIWAAFMTEATAEMEPLEFAVPEDVPDEVINAPPPAPPSPTRTAAPPTPTQVPTPTPTPTPEPPTGGPTIFPSPSIRDDGREDDP
ncbi:MAG TPA: transglycosylase domain-containing protein [Actinomycetota bacterium]|nr:transglycosylase domain-containing protein [Actinomycetota bacterium]